MKQLRDWILWLPTLFSTIWKSIKAVKEIKDDSREKPPKAQDEQTLTAIVIILKVDKKGKAIIEKGLKEHKPFDEA